MIIFEHRNFLKPLEHQKKEIEMQHGKVKFLQLNDDSIIAYIKD